MTAKPPGALALALALAAVGCTPMPKLPPTEKVAERLTGIGEPFVYRVEREPTDQPDTPADTLTFDQAVRLTLRHSPDVQSALARVRQAEAEAKQSRLLPNPILAVAFKLPTSGGRPDVEASLTADLLSLFAKPGQISAADQRLRKSAAESLTVVLDVLEAVQNEYAKLQALDAQLGIAETRRGILGELLRVTEARQQAGESAKLDVLTVQSELATLDSERLTLHADDRQSRYELARLIGQPSSAAEWAIEKWTPPAAVADDESHWQKAALQRRPELQAVVWELAALGQEMKLTRLTPFVTGGDAGITAEQTDGVWTLGPAASVAVPVFDVGQARRDNVAARIVEQRHELTRAERQIVHDVRVALERLRSSKAALGEVERRVIPLQNQRLSQSKDAYRLGLADVLAVRLAEQDLQRALSRQIELQEQVSQANHRLMRAVGGIPPAERLSATRPTELHAESNTP